MYKSLIRLTLCCLISCGTFAASADGAAQSRVEEPGQTIPSEESEPGFPIPGLISKVHVKNGAAVKKGQVLAELDTQVEQAALAKEQFLLKSNVQLRAAEAQRDLAGVKLKRAEKLFKEGAGSTLELEEAKLELNVSELKTELAREENEAKRLEIVKLTKQIEKMRMVSEFDGEVRKIEAAIGEVADPQKPAMTIVVNNPLKVAVKLPTIQTNTMKLGQSLDVRYADSKQWKSAKIVYFDPVADARVGKQLVHLELANPEGRRAGQEVIVKMPDNLAAAKE